MSIHSSLNMKTTLLLITLLCSISKLTFSQFCDTSNANTFSDCYLKTTFDDSITIQVDSAGWYNMGCQTESIINIDSASIWHIANAQKSGFNQAYSGTKVIVTDSINTYSVNADYYFDFKIWNYMTTGLRFKFKMDSDTLTDGGYIEVSFDNGNTFKNVLDPSIYNPNTGGFFSICEEYRDTLINGNVGISGSINEWTNYIIYDELFGLKSWGDTVVYRFHFVSDSIQTNKMGWMIDDIQTFQTFYPGNISETTSQFKTFPNPAKELLNVEILSSNFQPNWIEIFSASGDVIIREKYQSSIDIYELSSGIYFLKVTDDKSNGNTIKFIKE